MPSPLDPDNAVKRRAAHEQRNGRCFPLELGPDTFPDLNPKIRSGVASQLRWNGKGLACNRSLVTHKVPFVFRIIESEPRHGVVLRLPCETMLTWQMSKFHDVFVQRETVKCKHLIEVIPSDFAPPFD